MPKTDLLIHTKLRLPFTRPGLVPRPRLIEQIERGLSGPLTLITAPAGFGKTTLAASGVAGCGMPVAWLSLDKDDNQAERFLSYLAAALQETHPMLGSEAAGLLSAARQAQPERVLTSLINDLAATNSEIVLVLDDYQSISSQDIHREVAFLLDHCPKTFHLVIASRSDPPLALARLRARGQLAELRAVDLRFTEDETARFLNDVMGLQLDARSIALLEERTEGWIAGLQMAALSMRDRKDVSGFIDGFSGTNRYILDYLLEEVLASQPPEIQHFLLYTSLLERLTAPLCDAILESEQLEGLNVNQFSADLRPANLLACQELLEYLERANLFLVPLDEGRIWYRYHHLFADLLRTQLQKTLGKDGIAQLHVRAADWHGENGSILEAIHHASAASDEERVERYIEQNYRELVSRGEQSWIRLWTGKLSKDLVYRRPWLCTYEALSHSWYGELDEAEQLLAQAEKHIQAGNPDLDAQALLGFLLYVKSRVTAMRGDTQKAIELCLAARSYVPASNLALQLDTRITLGYEYFLYGDFSNASQVLNETIHSGINAGAIINTVAAACVLARLYAVQGMLHQSHDLYRLAAQSFPGASGQHLGAKALVEIGIADVHCEWNDLNVAMAHVKQGLALMPWWDKADDWILAYTTLARIHLAQANKGEAMEAIEQANQSAHRRGIFSEARQAAEVARVKLWLAHGDLQSAARWVATQEQRLSSDRQFEFENEPAKVALGRVWIAQQKLDQAIELLAQLGEHARSAGRTGRVIEITMLKALALQGSGDLERAVQEMTECLNMAEPERYVRLFLDEGQSMQRLLDRWLAHAPPGSLRDYAAHLLSQFDIEPQPGTAGQGKVFQASDLIEPLSPRELEVLLLVASGKTNQEIARQLFVSPGTVKAHTASIYRKLDVANRTEAAARARHLGIIP